MKTKRTAIIGLLSILLMILAGGLAYAATSGNSHGYNPGHPAVTATATATPGSHSQHPASQPGHGYQAHGGYWWCDGRWCGGWNHGYQGHGYQGNQGHGSPGYHGQHHRHHGTHHRNWGYQGGSYGGHRQGSGNGCCGGSWH